MTFAERLAERQWHDQGREAVAILHRTIDTVMAIKAVPPAERYAEQLLLEKLQQVFDSVSKAVLEQLLARSQAPSNEMARRIILQPFIEATGELAEITAADAVAAAARGRNRVLDQMSKAGVSDIVFDELPATVLSSIRESAFTASANTMKRLVGDVKISLEQGFREGLGTQDIADLLADQFKGMRDFELARVARTEVQALQNAGAQQTMRDLGVQYQKWVTAGDDRVRETHDAQDGEIAAINTPFSNGLRYPLDTDGPLEEWINCRCRAVPFIIPQGFAAPNAGPFTESDLVPVADATKDT